MRRNNLLPWPKDAVMIVANFPDQANRAHMQTVNPGTCRRCGREIVYDGFSHERATELCPGAPVKFFCVECFQLHDFKQVKCFEDHRFPKPPKA